MQTLMACLFNSLLKSRQNFPSQLVETHSHSHSQYADSVADLLVSTVEIAIRPHSVSKGAIFIVATVVYSESAVSYLSNHHAHSSGF